ncbi:hypothetical protein AAFC00_000556 [Neodothiora populina]|uniref:Major facilitator superfamily (MFS) profile domain-containing protein n=1 Tax=Neodothiora populina TaxID=2781224 RepID=A0ABR3PD95_9PEZI
MNNANTSERNPSVASAWSESKEKPQGDLHDSSNSVADAQKAEHAGEQQDNGDAILRQGWVCGGKHLETLKQDGAGADLDGPLTEVDIDMPLTRTVLLMHDGKEFIELKYAPGDTENPFKWPKFKRGFISALLNLMTLFIGLATTAYSSGIGKMVTELNCGTEMGQLGLFTFNIACAIAPMFLAPFCEMAGRKVVYVGGFFGFCLCFIGLALGKNIATIIVLRTILGLFGCIGTILVGGTFSDMYEPEERDKPMAMFSWIAILGTVGAPIYAGFIDMKIGWRWIEGIQGLANVPLLIIIVLFFKETRGGVFLKKRAAALRKATGDERYSCAMEFASPDIKTMLKNSSVKAIEMLVTEGVVFAFGLWIAFSWFIVFLFLSVIPITFEDKHHWNEGVAGLPYISLALGCTFGWIANNFLQIRKYNRLRQDPNHKIVPEDRLYGAMWGAPCLPIGLFIYSFTQYAYLVWVGPVIALAIISFGIFFIFESTYSYTADCYGESSSSAIAAQGLMRNSLGAVSPLFASQFFKNVGSQYAGLILSLLTLLLTVIPYVFFKYGSVLRAKSKRCLVY